MSVKRIENVYDLTQRLLGEINPQGETNIDAIRLLNLEQTIELTRSLISDIAYVSKYKERGEWSMRIAGEKADSFINELKEY